MASKPIKVSQLNAYIKRVLQSDPILANISVSGEISNLKFHGTGNIYFTLKDETSKINCFLGSEYLRDLNFELADGIEIIASGNIYLYERGGYYSLNVRDVTAAGEGSLNIAFNKMREKLEKEGLFDASRKRTLPAFPKRIAVATSETGAAVRDIITTIRNRNNYVEILVFPCLVQGPGAASDISDTIKMINDNYHDIDILIIGRGGGSMEELWSFNEEKVARSIYESRIPIISAVGHETDFTIADFTADVRAATPTAAAQMAVPDTTQIRIYLDELFENSRRSYEHRLRFYEMRIASSDFNKMQSYLLHRIQISELKIGQLFESCYQQARHVLFSCEAKLENCKAAFENLNPTNILGRGYCLMTDQEGKFITSVRNAAPGEETYVIMRDGSIGCTINEVITGEYANV